MKTLRRTAKKYYKIKEYSLPQLTSYHSEGALILSGNVIVYSTNYAYKPFFRTTTDYASFNMRDSSGQQWIEYQFVQPLAPSTYTIIYSIWHQSNVTMTSCYWTIIYTDGSTKTISSATSTTSSTEHSAKFTATKAIRSIKMYFEGNCPATNYHNFVLDYVSLIQDNKSTNTVSIQTKEKTTSTDSSAYTQNETVYYAKKGNVIKYYKWGSPDVITVGSPTINNGVVSGLSDSNYLKIDNRYKSDNATYVFKFTTGNITGIHAVIHNEYFISIEINGSSVFGYNWSANANQLIFTAEANTTYWVKIVVNGKNKTYSYSTDGVTFTGEQTVTDNSLSVTNVTWGFCLGRSSYQTGRPFDGTIDLKDCYMMQNGNKIWTGLALTQGTKSDYVQSRNEKAYFMI